MKLITTRGQLDLPTDFEFEIEKNSPFFSDAGEQSIPVTLPATPRNLAALGYPDRIAGKGQPLRKIEAELISGIIHKGGQLIFNSVGPDGIEAALALAESDLYSKNKDKSIRELFADEYRDDFASSTNKIRDWVLYFRSLAMGTATDVFNVFPAFSDDLNDEAGNIFVFNKPLDIAIQGDPEIDISSSGGRIVTKDGYEVVPDGYGVTPFLYLHSFISLLFAQLGYTVNTNFFAASPYNKLVLLNNNADTICPGKICMGDIVPSCTVGEFIDWLEDKFHCTAIVNSSAKEVEVISMEDILGGDWDMDLSGMADGTPTVAISEPSHIVLSSDTSIDGVAPPCKTLQEFKKKYGVLTEMDESEFAAENNHYVIFRKATGTFHVRKLSLGDDSTQVVLVGSNTFTYDRKNNDSGEDASAADLIPLMMERVLDATPNYKVIGPYIGERVSRNTGYANDKTAKNEQKIILALDAGWAATDETHAMQYRLCTTQKYDNLGTRWNAWGLNTEDMYPVFWKKYNGLLLNCQSSLTVKMDYTPTQLQKIRLDLLKLYKGVKLLPKRLAYSVGDGVVCGDSEFMIVKTSSEDISDSPISIPSQQYRWEFASEAQAIIDEYAAGHQIDDSSIIWIDEDSQDYRYISPPTGVGQKICDFTRTVSIYVFNGDDHVILRYNTPINCWYESVPME